MTFSTKKADRSVALTGLAALLAVGLLALVPTGTAHADDDAVPVVGEPSDLLLDFDHAAVPVVGEPSVLLFDLTSLFDPDPIPVVGEPSTVLLDFAPEAVPVVGEPSTLILDLAALFDPALWMP